MTWLSGQSVTPTGGVTLVKSTKDDTYYYRNKEDGDAVEIRTGGEWRTYRDYDDGYPEASMAYSLVSVNGMKNARVYVDRVLSEDVGTK